MRCVQLLLVLVLALSVTVGGSEAGLTRIKIYLQNPTSGTAHYQFKVGGDDWKTYKLSSGASTSFVGIAPHVIRFKAKGVIKQYSLLHGRTYYFNWSNGKLDLRHR